MDRSIIPKYRVFEKLAKLTIIDISHDSGSVRALRLLFRLFLFPLFLIYRALEIIATKVLMTPLLYILFSVTDIINKFMPIRKRRNGLMRLNTRFIMFIVILYLILNMSQNYLPRIIKSIVPVSATDFQDSQKSNTKLRNSNPYMFDQDREEELNEIIQHAIAIYHQDVINKADFALKLNGGQIIYSLTSQSFQHIPRWLHFLHWYTYTQVTLNSPEMAISPHIYVGECWSMFGNTGTLGIQLGKPILIQGLTVDYPSCEVMHNKMDNAPRQIELIGIPNAAVPKNDHVSLGFVEYKIDCGSPIQTFDIVQNPATVDLYSAVMIKIHSNWGNKNHTDIYRIRIHGLSMEEQ